MIVNVKIKLATIMLLAMTLIAISIPVMAAVNQLGGAGTIENCVTANDTVCLPPAPSDADLNATATSCINDTATQASETKPDCKSTQDSVTTIPAQRCQIANSSASSSAGINKTCGQSNATGSNRVCNGSKCTKATGTGVKNCSKSQMVTNCSKCSKSTNAMA